MVAVAVGAVALLIILVVSLITIRVVTVKGNEIGVKETWTIFVLLSKKQGNGKKNQVQDESDRGDRPNIVAERAT